MLLAVEATKRTARQDTLIDVLASRSAADRLTLAQLQVTPADHAALVQAVKAMTPQQQAALAQLHPVASRVAHGTIAAQEAAALAAKAAAELATRPKSGPMRTSRPRDTGPDFW